MNERIKKALATEGLETAPGSIKINGEFGVVIREIQQPTIGKMVYDEYVSKRDCTVPIGLVEWLGNRGAEIAIDRALKEVEPWHIPDRKLRIRAIAPTQEQ